MKIIMKHADHYLREKQVNRLLGDRRSTGRYLYQIAKKDINLFFEYAQLSPEEFRYTVTKLLKPYDSTVYPKIRQRFDKLADQLEEVRTIGQQPPDEQLRIAFQIEYPDFPFRLPLKGVFDGLQQLLEGNNFPTLGQKHLLSFKDLYLLPGVPIDELAKNTSWTMNRVNQLFARQLGFLRLNPIIRQRLHKDYISPLPLFRLDTLQTLVQTGNNLENTTLHPTFIIKILATAFPEEIEALGEESDLYLRKAGTKHIYGQMYLIPARCLDKKAFSAFLTSVRQQIDLKRKQDLIVDIATLYHPAKLRVTQTALKWIKSITLYEYPYPFKYKIEEKQIIFKRTSAPSAPECVGEALRALSGGPAQIRDIIAKAHQLYPALYNSITFLHAFKKKNHEVFPIGKTGMWGLTETYPDFEIKHGRGTIPNMAAYFLSLHEEPQHTWAITKYINSLFPGKFTVTWESVHGSLSTPIHKASFPKYKGCLVGLAGRKKGEIRDSAHVNFSFHEGGYIAQLSIPPSGVTRSELISLLVQRYEMSEIHADYLIECSLKDGRLIEKDKKMLIGL